ncbi:MAG: DUF515 domain-containing protein [Candidatus Hydrothermarchaeaceae archaeon]
MADEDSSKEKSTEDIVERLEALRKRVPEDKAEKVEEVEEGELEEKLPTERRQKIARVVGIAVIVLVVVGTIFGVYKGLYEPSQKKKIEATRIEQEKKQELSNAQESKFREINDAFLGLPSKYTPLKFTLLDELMVADTLPKINAINVMEPANSAWRGYRKEQLDEKSTVTEKIKIIVGNDTYRGYDGVKQKIEQYSYKTLKVVTIVEYFSEYFPIRLTREQYAGGWAEQGNLVNIWLREDDTSSILARNARVVAVLRGSSSGVISLTESESKTASGAGAEGKGTISSISSGGVGSIPGSFPASAGYQTTQTATSFSVDISQIQKAAAASKLPESYIENILGNYGVKLNRIEASTGIADFGAVYIILFEVGEEEVPGLVLKASPSSTERTNIVVTIARPSSPIENIP